MWDAMTAAQWKTVEEMGEKYHVVLVDPVADRPGAVKLTPARFCESCGGDGIDTEGDASVACAPCNGRGGIPVIYQPVTVLPDGSPA